MTQDDPERMQVQWQQIACRLRRMIIRTLDGLEVEIDTANGDDMVRADVLRVLSEAAWHGFILEQSAANMASRITREGGYQQ